MGEIAEKGKDVLNIETLETEVTAYVAKAGSVEVADDTDYEMADEFSGKLKDLIKRVKTTFGPYVKDAYDHYKRQKARENEMVKPLEDALREIRKAMSAYQTEQERQRRIEQKMIDAKRKEEQTESAEEYAQVLEEQGEKGMADAVRKEAARMPTGVKAESHAPKGKSTRRVTKWHFEVEDLDKVPREWMMLNEKAVQQYANSAKANARIPGIKIWSTVEVQ